MSAPLPPATDTPSAPVDLRRRKFNLALSIMGTGMLIALIWVVWHGWALGEPYPANTFLFNPVARYSDWTDCLMVARLPDPYVDPLMRYLPFTWLLMRALSPLPDMLSLIIVFYASLAALLLLMVAVFRDVIADPTARVFRSLFAMMICYPLLFCFDRGNLELLLAPLLGGAIYFISKAKYLPAMLCLVPAICLKAYPVLLLMLFLRQGKIAASLVTAAGCAIITLVSLWGLAIPFQEALELYNRNAAVDANVYVYQLFSIESCASLWNVLAIVLKGAAYCGFSAPVYYTYDDPGTHLAYVVYSALMLLFGVAVTVYVCLLEKEYLRCIMVMLLFTALIVPSGGDYHLLFAAMALVVLIITRTLRPRDFTVLVLLALVMVPIKEIHLGFVGNTEGGEGDVPLAALLDTPLVLAAIAFLVNDSRATWDWRWTQLRVRRLTRAVMAWFPMKMGRAPARPVSAP